jgi:hypothetical protein
MSLAENKTFIVTKDCKEIIIPNNYKKLILQIKSTNIDKVLLTDQRIDSCNDEYDIRNCCSANSTFCMENKNPSYNDFRLNYCIDYTFLYACIFNKPNDISNNADLDIVKEGNIKVTTDVVRGHGCNTAEFIPEVECSSLGLNACKDPKNCYKRCKYVECRTNELDVNTKVFSMCLPSNYTRNDISEKCKNHISFNNSMPGIYQQQCDRTLSENEHGKKESSRTFFKFLAVIFGMAMLITFIASVYYRFKLSIDNSPPFEPPSLCPNFIFPRTPTY